VRFVQRDLAPSRWVRRSSMTFCASLHTRSFLKHASSSWPSPVQKPHLTPGLFWWRGPAALARSAASPDGERRGLRWASRSVCSTWNAASTLVRVRSFWRMIARQCAEHRHERELVVEVVEPVIARADLGGAELLDAGEGVLNVRCDGGERLVRALGHAEEFVVRGGPHARHLRDVHELESVPDALGVRALVLDVRLLRAGEVGKDVAGGLLLALVVRAELLLVLERYLAVEDEHSMWERLSMALGVLLVQDERRRRQLLCLAHDHAEDAELVQARLHGGAPGWVVGLLKIGHGELRRVVQHGVGVEGEQGRRARSGGGLAAA
jgi:hypothetical protein